MATWDDVRRLALALPQTAERVSRDGLLAWDVRDKTFAWERPLRRGDLQALGGTAPKGPVLAARVPDLGAKEALLAEAGGAWFTTPHFNGYPAVLVRLAAVDVKELRELVTDAWRCMAPKTLVAELDGD
ncbi:MAG TPA: MmcQ/YjbR family DNA-binding protein, partial [Actinomycetes bacterium]|nr:MmcQ/YjbR family DNA-binding protein [Actinomycetes bacterium]